MLLYFSLSITPQVKQRPRMARGMVYTPAKTAQFERAVATMAKVHMGNQKPLTGPLKLTARFVFKRPKKPARSYPSKGDTTNFLKALEDGCNGVVWVDDVQIVEIHAHKLYDVAEGESRIEMRVEEVSE